MVAEAEGFEPSHAGIKIQCLNQLGDASIETEIIARGGNYCKRFASIMTHLQQIGRFLRNLGNLCGFWHGS